MYLNNYIQQNTNTESHSPVMASQSDRIVSQSHRIESQTHNLPPEMRFTIKRGWGTMTVVNLDPSQEGEIGFLTTRQSDS